MELWNLFIDIYNFVIGMFESFTNLWNYEFTINIGGGLTIAFKDILTTGLITIMVALLIKKLVPAA